jgi:hypothetical protein
MLFASADEFERHSESARRVRGLRKAGERRVIAKIPAGRMDNLLLLDDPNEGAIGQFSFEQMNHATLYVALEFLSRGTR